MKWIRAYWSANGKQWLAAGVPGYESSATMGLTNVASCVPSLHPWPPYLLPGG